MDMRDELKQCPGEIQFTEVLLEASCADAVVLTGSVVRTSFDIHRDHSDHGDGHYDPNNTKDCILRSD
jgi:hypothetical protein